MKTILAWTKSTEDKPTDEQDGKKFLLCWGGWQYGLYRWSSEHRNFYCEAGDFLVSENPFLWAELPTNLTFY